MGRPAVYFNSYLDILPCTVNLELPIPLVLMKESKILSEFGIMVFIILVKASYPAHKINN